MTRRALLTAVTVVASLLCAAQSSAEEPSVYGQYAVSGGYGAPVMKASTLAGEGILLVGGEAGWVLAHSVFVGGGGYGSVTSVVSPPSLQSTAGDARLGLGYGGLRMGGIIGNELPLHGSFALLLGGGSAWTENRDLSYHRSETFLVIEPQVEAEANLGRHVRFALGGGYRLIGNTEAPGFTPRRLGGPVGTLTLRVGEF